MIIYPAIDIRGGRVVRLKEGDPARQTVFGDDPLATARLWMEAGAAWIHMVNLDGAFSEANDNLRIVEAVARLGVRVQFGGGLRQMDDLARAFEAGVSRVVLGTAAVQQPVMVAQAVEQWGAERVCVGLDARDGRIATHGWQQMADLTPVELGRQMAALGVRHALYTDVSRDGGLQGVNVGGTARLAQATGLQVIASGGVRALDDIRALAATGMVAGAIIGMALYEKRFTLQEALTLAGGVDAG
ncbi:MAG: 1-(5-phosphoribosyl)-5-[(5-phosphoribosylamino)methylideneamino]imidazole-4-carboxamide isomerase [Chloroflexi bacterium]|nr:1-(5-phosphoribosyl)-5-[(5-phosphoribosylamino)methylideneamino]imidazole-4-carboxamide isomerase [Chloroflexota bacterium]MDL1884665.1 1-(5-phosphoribosyl)-5-[(5-phosphoribosylamino)methylideneamino]imidazole-4-carboxamide isomerase [Anaerolineae bacterium CFX8]